MTVEDDAVVHGVMGHAVGGGMGVLYADNGIIGLRRPEWLQGSLNVIIGLFCHICLMFNITKSKTITCQMGTIWSVMSE